MKVISLEGNIGAGKSTTLSKLKEILPDDLSIQIIEEPVLAFQTYKHFNPLELLYLDPLMNSGFAQMHIIEEQLKHYKDTVNNSVDILLCERSLYSPIIFTKTLASLGYVSPFVESKLLDASIKAITTVFPGNPFASDAVFYLDTPVDICFKRIALRDRLAEDQINITYLSTLEAEYHNFLQETSSNVVRWNSGSDNRAHFELKDFIIEQL